MKVVITGASGFVGRALSGRLAAVPLSSDQQLLLVDRAPVTCPPGAVAIMGDVADPAMQAELARRKPDLVFHLSAVPGGASEDDPRLSRRINLDATLTLMETLAGAAPRSRFLYASSIAVFGVPLPAYVDDETIARPGLTYGTHKLMVETALADVVRRGDLEALALRLPGIVARPAGPSGLKSAFMSDLFHCLRARKAITLPVAAAGRVWITSIARCIDNLVAAATADWIVPADRTAITMPALHVSIGAMVASIADQTGADRDLVRYKPDSVLEAQFAAYPPLATPAAEAMGLRTDADLASLVARTLAAIDGP